MGELAVAGALLDLTLESGFLVSVIIFALNPSYLVALELRLRQIVSTGIFYARIIF